MNNQRFKTKKLTLSSLIVALNVITLYLSTIIPTNKITLFALSSVFILAVVIESGMRYAFLTYVSTSILSLIIIPNKIILIPYIVFFGYYGITKYYIESRNKLIIEWIIKYILFNLAMIIIYYITAQLFIDVEILNKLLWAKILILEIGFFIYDYMYTLLIDYYNKKLRR